MVALATRCAEQKPPLPHLETPSSDPIPRPERTTEWQPQRRLRPEEVALLVTMRETGSEINDLAEHFGIHRSTVIAHLNRQGVEGRRRQGRALSDERLHQAGEFYVAGHSLIETGDRSSAFNRSGSPPDAVVTSR